VAAAAWSGTSPRQGAGSQPQPRARLLLSDRPRTGVARGWVASPRLRYISVPRPSPRGGGGTMAAAVSWYGPLIDLSAAAGHVGGFVQLLAAVRRVLPHQVIRNPTSASATVCLGRVQQQHSSDGCCSSPVLVWCVYIRTHTEGRSHFSPFLGTKRCDREDVPEDHR